MKKLWLFLLFCSAAFGQTASISAHLQDPATGAVGSRTFLRFELKNTGGNQCRVGGTALLTPYIKDFSPNSSGVVSGTIYQNSSITCGTQTGNTQWAFTIWRDGKPQPSCFTQITTTPINLDSVTCSNTTPVVSPPTGDGTYCRLDGSNCGFTGNVTHNAHNDTGIATLGAVTGTFSGALTAQSVNGRLCVGASPCYANVAAAVAAAGSTNKTIIEIEGAPNYAGTDCGAAQDNLTYIDYRGMNPPCNANNSLHFNSATSAVTHMGMENYLFVTSLPTGTAMTATQSTSMITGTLPGAGGLADGTAATAFTTGALSGTLGTLRGAELAAGVNGIGGAVTLAEGAVGYVAGFGGATVTIGTVRGLTGMGCNSQTYGVSPTNCYGAEFLVQQNKGTARNYSAAFDGPIIIRYDGSFSSASQIDAEDNAGAAHTVFKVDSANNTIFQAATTNGTFFNDSGSGTQFKITGSGPTVPAAVGLRWTEGTAPGGAAGIDSCYGDSTLHGKVCNYNNTTFNPVGSRAILTADWTCGTAGTVSSCVAATIIGSGGGVPWTFNLPLVANSLQLDCDGVVGQATAATLNQWNLLTATNGATNVTASYTMATAATAMAVGAVTDQASTTTTFQIAPSWTLGGTATKMPFHIHAAIEGASASGTVLSVQLVAPTVADLVTIYRGSGCWIHP